MAREIAVYTDIEGNSTGFSEPGKLCVFRRGHGLWENSRERAFSLCQAKGMYELRQAMGGLLSFLGECRIVVARSATGVPYFELEKAGCSIWEISGRPEHFLDRVWQDEEQERTVLRQTPSAIPAPEEISPGTYFISIQAIQDKNADFSSKQVLQQFIHAGAFRSLTISCSHVPPWLEAEAIRFGLGYEAEQRGKNEFRVKITKK